MIWGIHISRAVYAVAELGIADLLADGPVSPAELARATGTHEPSLYRVLRLLAALGVFDEIEPRCFGLTVLGDRLRSDAPAGMRSWAIFLEAVGGARPFGHILDTVQNGKPGPDIAFGTGIFSSSPGTRRARPASTPPCRNGPRRSRRALPGPTISRTFAGSWTSAAARERCWSRSCAGTLICRESCSRRPRWPPGPGRYSTRPVSVSDAKCWPETSSRRSRPGRLLHPGQCPARLGRRARRQDPRQLPPGDGRGGRVLIVERLIPEEPGDAVPTLLSDINMLVITGGQERTNAEYGQPPREGPALRSAPCSPLRSPTASSKDSAPDRLADPTAGSWSPVSLSSCDLAGLKDMDGLGQLPGAPWAAAEFAQDVPCLELGVGALAGGS